MEYCQPIYDVVIYVYIHVGRTCRTKDQFHLFLAPFLIYSLSSSSSHSADFFRLTMDLRESIINQTGVSLALAKQVLLTKSQESNSVFSPLSVHVVLSLIAAGSKGQTLEQTLSFLNSKSKEDLNSLSSQLVSLVFADGSPSGGPRLSFANGVWIEKSLSLQPSFRQIVDNDYKAACSPADFQTKVSYLCLSHSSRNWL